MQKIICFKPNYPNIMQRQIKFKAKAKDTGEWFYGSYVFLPDSNSHHIIPCGSYKPHLGAFAVEQVEIDPVTLGQYTNLNDVKGAEIYEGDILRMKRNDDNEYEAYVTPVGTYGEVDYDGDDFDSTLLEWVWSECDIEVIGNVHDKPLAQHGDARQD